MVLRDLIAPYLLRRRKADVARSLPKKTEQVLFTMLGPDQRDLYRSYLSSQEVQDILEVGQYAGKSAMAAVVCRCTALFSLHSSGETPYVC